VQRIVGHAYAVGRDKKVDPLLILAVTAIESSLNPLAQSSMGAQGLMQVMTRVHAERFEPHGGEAAALDPLANLEVGAEILRELISRGGSVERGLQLYVGAGNLPDDGGYGAKVLAERQRLQSAAKSPAVAGAGPARPAAGTSTDPAG
jgi:soluble lytic murein transglycosylase-like protein